jgi:hypothetical protein
MTDQWRRRIAELLEAQPALLSTSIHDLLAAEGFTSSSATIAREAGIIARHVGPSCPRTTGRDRWSIAATHR